MTTSLQVERPRVVDQTPRIVNDRRRGIAMVALVVLGSLGLLMTRHKIPINISWGLGNKLGEQDDIYAELCKRAAKNVYLPQVGNVFDEVIYAEVDPKNPSLCKVQDADGSYPLELSLGFQLPGCTAPISDDEKRSLSQQVNVTANPFKQVGQELKACFEIGAIDF